MQTQEDNQYEIERAKRIAQNKERLKQLGVIESAAALAQTAVDLQSHIQATLIPPKPRRQKASRRADRKPTGPLRESKRLRGHAAPPPDAAAEIALQETEEKADSGRGTNSKGNPSRRCLQLPQNTTFAAPFTLRSISTTVWDLGALHRGAWAQTYWSNPGCLYHHAYPVGYRATKEVFNKIFEMRIESGPVGPLFIVKDTSTGREFSGTSPTKPWTDVCLYQKTGQRISGPLFFGFSDPITQRAIATCLYNERELAAALAGEVVHSEEDPTRLELAAQDFMQNIRGVGQGVAIVLARTEALGGRKHDGVESLKSWLRKSPQENVVVLTTFLLTSEEMPVTTRKWPLWKEKIVHGIVNQLMGEQSNKENIDVRSAMTTTSTTPPE